MEQHRTVRSEFSRQAEAFARSEALRSPQLTERVGRALGEVGRVLDLACGPGVLAETLSRRARQVVAVDLTPRTLALARERANEEGLANLGFALGFAERVPCADRSFDAVVLRLALHHFEEPARVLRECHRLLRPGGRLVVLDVLTSADPEVAELHNALERLRDPSHVALWPRAALRGALEEQELRVVSESCWHMPRRFREWAEIIAEPQRMASLEVVLRRLARAGSDAGIALREEDGELWFSYEFALLVASPAASRSAT